MADIVQGLFGITPEAIEKQRMADLNSVIAAQAQKSRNPLLAYGAGQFGASLGAGLGKGLMSWAGIEDPEIKKATTIQSVLQNVQSQLGQDAVDPTKSYPLMIQMFNDAGLSDVAAMASYEGSKKIQEWNVSQAQIAKDKRSSLKDNYIVVNKKLYDVVNQKYVTDPSISATIKDDLYADATSTDEYKAIASSVYTNPNKFSPEQVDQATKLLNVLQTPVGEGYVRSFGNPLQQQPNGQGGGTDVTMNALPGSKADVKQQADKEQQIRKLVTSLDDSEYFGIPTVQKAIALAEKAPEHVTGLDYKIAQDFPGTPAMTMKGYLTSLVSKLAKGTIEEMKNQSSTGATGFGSLNKEELSLIQSELLSLNPEDKEFVPKLKSLEKRMVRIQNRLKEEYSKVTGSKYVSPSRKSAFSFPEGFEPSEKQLKFLNAAMNDITNGVSSKGEVIAKLKASSVFKGVPFEELIGE